MLVNLDTMKITAKKEGVNSAVYNEQEDLIIAGLDQNENGLVCLKPD